MSDFETGSGGSIDMSDDIEQLSKQLFAPFNWYRFCLDHLSLGSAEDELRPVLDPLEVGLRATQNRIKGWAAGPDDDEGWTQLAIDDECGYVDDLLGATFVVAQRFLTTVVAGVRRLGDGIEAKTGTRWSLPADKDGWLNKYGPQSRQSGVTFAALLNASANYFKHEPEWRFEARPPDQDADSDGWIESTWEKDKNNRRTIEIITTAGMGVGAGWSGNCRALARALGVDDYGDLGPIERGLDGWATAVKEVVEDELTRRGLI